MVGFPLTGSVVMVDLVVGHSVETLCPDPGPPSLHRSALEAAMTHWARSQLL